ncbi:protein RRNAD1 isoform X2 [Mangifera indica]|uniref:protein RRNAD1 isoform X2 n=1 Tax=Mangifera indica TaxID=29780 RepID=UPI001CFBF15B|nr:protein RRNAD1 isoform X2 [Mangifera indica]
MQMAGQCKYSCETAAETFQWIKAIVDFLKPFTFLISAHVVNFFTDKLWEAVDKDWIDSLRNEPIENLLLIPSGVVQDHWPDSLKEFVLTLKSLLLPREQADLYKVLPGWQVTSLSSVLAQGMNLKKKHEGYLAQVLSFQFQHSVVAIDACSHHGKVTNARAERIKKHYSAQIRKFGSENRSLNMPKTITCQVMSIDMLRALTNMSLPKDDVEQPKLTVQDNKKLDERKLQTLGNTESETSLVLAGLHACGDLSVTMLKTFVECKEVKAVVSIGCCYNLLTEEGFDIAGSLCGFPMSCGVKSANFPLGKNSRDLACQSAERWGSLHRDAGVHNFELHAFRAAFQMVLSRSYTEVIKTSPSVGRQGKALRRQQQRRILESCLQCEQSSRPSFNQKHFDITRTTVEIGQPKADDKSASILDKAAVSHGNSSYKSMRQETAVCTDKYLLFEKFCLSGLCRLGLKPVDSQSLCQIWDEVEPFADIIGPYWSLRAALGPLLETYILLDRLLFLQEQGSHLEAVMLPIFDPVLSPRNVAVIAKKK